MCGSFFGRGVFVFVYSRSTAYERKVAAEEAERLRKQQEVERMEQEELRLIEALKMTQLQQKAAYSELEEALNTSKAVFVSKSREFVQAVSSSPTNLLGASRSFSRQSLDRSQQGSPSRTP
jgi:hypothetical protein